MKNYELSTPPKNQHQNNHKTLRYTKDTKKNYNPLPVINRFYSNLLHPSYLHGKPLLNLGRWL